MRLFLPLPLSLTGRLMAQQHRFVVVLREAEGVVTSHLGEAEVVNESCSDASGHRRQDGEGMLLEKIAKRSGELTIAGLSAERMSVAHQNGQTENASGTWNVHGGTCCRQNSSRDRRMSR